MTTRTVKWPWILVAGVVLFDQLTKQIVKASFTLNESRPVLGDFFRLTYIHNTGGAFGVQLGTPLFYLVSSAMIIGILVLYFFTSRAAIGWSGVSLSLVLGGAIGNLIDRIAYGKVIDFLDFEFFDIAIRPCKLLFWQFPGYQLERWPIFNIADSAVTCGILLLLATTLVIPRKSPSQVTPVSVTPPAQSG